MHADQLHLIDAITAKIRSITPSEMATADVSSKLVSSLVELDEFCLAEVWSVDPRKNRLVLMTYAAKAIDRLPSDRLDVLSGTDSLTGAAVEAKRLTVFSDLEHYSKDGRRFRDRELRDSLNLVSMCSVPIINTSNPHQVLCVLNVFPVNGIDTHWSSIFRSLAQFLAASIEGNLRERCYRMATLLGFELATFQERKKDAPLSMDEACYLLADCCKQAVNASSCSIYLYDPISRILAHRVTVGAENSEPARIPEQVHTVYRENRESLAPRIEQDETFVDSITCSNDSCILVPLQDLLGKCQGVIRCLRNNTGSSSNAIRFCYDDIAILDAMSQAFIPPLETLQESARRQFSLQKLCHEIRVPAAAFRALVHRMQDECREAGFRFKHPHFKEADIYADLMSRLLKELDVARYGPSQIPLRFALTDIERQVIIPAKRFTIPLLRQRRLFTWQLDHLGFERFPKLKVDPALVTQVVFNLLDNAIKYYEGDLQRFRCEIRGGVTSKHYEIMVCDNGPGIDESLLTMENVEYVKEDKSVEVDFIERLFKYGVRGGDVKPSQYGEGLGMWISRAIAKRHGGDLRIRKPDQKWSTCFVLQLPLTLR